MWLLNSSIGKKLIMSVSGKGMLNTRITQTIKEIFRQSNLYISGGTNGKSYSINKLTKM